jgi:hypothetical protein
MKFNYYNISFKKFRFKGMLLNDADAATLRKHEEVVNNFYSFTTLRPHTDGKLYIGTTHMKNRLLWTFDPQKKTFEDLGYDKVGEVSDVKIHRSFEYDSAKKVFYGVSSALHLEDEYFKFPGSKIFIYSPETMKIEFIGTPLPHEYTQTITFDPQRRLLYGFTYHTFSFYVYDVDKKETIYRAMPGSISHISAIDDSGCIWSTWGRDQHYLFKYDPDINDIIWTRKTFPEGGQSYMYPGAGPIDCMLNGGDGFLYVALETGSLVRMDPKTMAFEYLGRPSPHPRMPALIIGPDGLLYGTCGDNWNVSIFSFNRETRSFKIIAEIAAGDERCYRPHDICFMGKNIYVGETDNPQRTGYLWEIIF